MRRIGLTIAVIASRVALAITNYDRRDLQIAAIPINARGLVPRRRRRRYDQRRDRRRRRSRYIIHCP